MKNLYLLPGNSAKNRKWIEDIRASLKEIFANSEILYYDHWKTGEEIIDIDVEIDKFYRMVERKKDYIIFAKSIGIGVVLKAVFEGKINPGKCIFVGTPVNWCRANNFDIEEWIEGFSIPSLFIQQTKDPAFSFRELKDLVKKKNVKNYLLKEVEGNDHNYDDIDEIKRFIVGFL